MVWRGVMAAFLQDETRLIDLEGAFRSSKTTACLRKIAKSCLKYPGIHWWMNRYSDGDTQRQLKPQWIAMMTRMGIVPRWDATSQAYVLENGSTVYIFGVKAQDQLARYSKIRGLTLAGIYNDQSEELPKDVFQEFNGRLSQPGFPHQLLLSPNPPDEGHWLATDEFRAGPVLQQFGQTGGAIYAVANRTGGLLEGRRYYAVPIYANAQNLSPATIRTLESVYPPEHPKHRSAVLGLRGMNVMGEPVYLGAFDRIVHEQPIDYDPSLRLQMALDFGKHHPCVVFRQVSPLGQVRVLGGIFGQNLYLEDFMDIVIRYRADWFPRPVGLQECCDPAGAADTSHGTAGAVKLLREKGFRFVYIADANSPAVRLGAVERLAAQMRKRLANRTEALVVNAQPDRWLRVSAEAVVSDRFVAAAFEAGYVWDVHLVSVNNKPMRKPKKDGWYEHGMNCCEYLEVNFGAAPVRERRPAPPRISQRLLRADLGWMA
jgi:hypothetical protein